MATQILIVDDEPDVLGAWERALQLAGYTVTATSSTAEAIEACKATAFDLVILDFIMPGKTGLELLNDIRAQIPTIRSIIVSGKVDSNDSEDDINAELRADLESDAYFHKPLKNEQLLEMIASLLAADESRNWRDVADRQVNARKPMSTVRKAEKALRKHKKPSGRKK